MPCIGSVPPFVHADSHMTTNLRLSIVLIVLGQPGSIAMARCLGTFTRTMSMATARHWTFCAGDNENWSLVPLQ